MLSILRVAVVMVSFHSNRTVMKKVIRLKRIEVGWSSNCCLHKSGAENSAAAQSTKLDASATIRPGSSQENYKSIQLEGQRFWSLMATAFT